MGLNKEVVSTKEDIQNRKLRERIEKRIEVLKKSIPNWDFSVGGAETDDIRYEIKTLQKLLEESKK